MTRGTMRVALATGLLSGLSGLLSCVSQSTYEVALRDVENARLRYQQETQRNQALTDQIKQMKVQVEDLESKLRIASETTDRATREYKQVREELLALKMQQDQERQQARSRLRQSQRQLEQERAVLETESDLHSRYQAASEETKERVRALLEEIQSLLAGPAAN